MKNIYKYIGFFLGLFAFIFVACDDNIDPIQEELEVNRVFSPLDFEVKIRNQTTAELSWKLRDDADSYIVEFSQDSLEFNSIFKTVEVQPGEIPLKVTLDGETRYSARVKGVSKSGVANSKWSEVTFTTDPENIFLPMQDGDVDALYATVRWPANSEVTHFIINPGNVERIITADEKTAGEATIADLTGDTNYTVVLYNDSKHRGSVDFKTLIDVGDATRVYPEDDLSAIVAAASPGDVLVLYEGEYLAYTGTLNIDKSISIRGLLPYNKPVVHIQFVLQSGAQDVTISDLEMDGTFIDPTTSTEMVLDHSFQYGSSGIYGSLNVTGCNIHDYSKSLFSNSSSSVIAEIASVSMDNCVATNILTNSADCIDFRYSYLASLSLTNSTFNNCAPGRDFVRIDASGLSGTGLQTNVLIDHCTLYGVSNTTDRILYVRFSQNALTVNNTLIAATNGYYTNQSSSAQPSCSNNNYFSASGFYTDAYVTGAKIDQSGNYTTLDPGFADAASGDFTVANQTLIDNNVGDPRWLP